MVDKMIIDSSPKQSEMENKTSGKAKKSLKRKADEIIRHYKKESETLIAEFRREVDCLYKYYSEVCLQKVQLEWTDGPTNFMVACLLEESTLPFSKLVGEIYEKLKVKEGITLATVRTAVLHVGQRLMFGVANADADVLEDDSESCLWCWETRDMRYLPTMQRGILNVRRICRRNIQKRITALSAMISALLMQESHCSYKIDVMKAYGKLGKTLDEAHIRSLVGSLLQRNSSDMVEKEAKLKEKELIQEQERNKREAKKEKKRMDHQLKKQKLHTEKELKRMQYEAEREARHREKEAAELKKQVKRQQDEAEKDQKRREKEEAQLRKQLAIKKQATIMKSFLNSKKSDLHDNRFSEKELASDSSGSEDPCSSIVSSMDCALAQKDSAVANEFLKLHLVSWQKLKHSNRCSKSQHWGIRRKPKTSLIKELKLQGSSSEAAPNNCNSCSEVDKSNQLSLDEKLVHGWEETVPKDMSCHENLDVAVCSKTKKLLQFDKSYRPAYYGTVSRKSDVVGPRHPFKKDPHLDYDIDSDEEWEEDDPGESLSDCDKDEDEENLEEDVKVDDEDESEDSFMVPDGYLSENEGVQVDKMESDATDDEARSFPICKQNTETEEFRTLLRQQKFLFNLTEQALRKNQPLIIANLMHEKAALLMAEDLNGTAKLEKICLQALSMRCWPGGACIEISTDQKAMLTEDLQGCASQNTCNTKAVCSAATALDSELPKIVGVIQSCSHGINKLVESLQCKFPAVPKAQLRHKVKEISEFADNRWQVKKEILDKLGLSASPEKGIVRRKGIATFFSKRLMPSGGENINNPESSPQQLCKLKTLRVENRCMENM